MPSCCGAEGLYARLWQRQSGGFLGAELATLDRTSLDPCKPLQHRTDNDPFGSDRCFA